MKSTLQFRAALLAAALTTSLAGTAAFAQVPLPSVQRSGPIEYVSGGISTEESQAFLAAAAHWPLALEFGVDGGGGPRAQYAADVQVAIRDSAGRPVLQTRSTGPYLLVKLPPGRYAVDATFGGRVMAHSIEVREGQPTKHSFIWPASVAG